MHDRVGRAGRLTVVVAFETEMRRQRIERLPIVGEIGDQRVDARQFERLQVDVEYRVPLCEQMRHGVAAGLAGSAGEDDAFA